MTTEERKNLEQRKREIENLLHNNRLSGCSILDREDVEDLENELDSINSKLKGL